MADFDILFAAPRLHIAFQRANILLTWNAISGKTYRVEFKNDIGDAWAALEGDVTATNSIASKSDDLRTSQRFYRIVVLP